ncbi:MAG: hypothetical protein L6R40_000028 [Gallowayella cf. fulva]|nr:MAG: hypothetical protein L6R40_000028 [Xanthomendoza cf. fulva]
MSVTSTDTVIAAPTRESIRFLGSSIDSLSPPRQRNSHISNVYKEASTLFLTKRLAEAFATLEPIVTVAEPSEDTAKDEDETERVAPIATASRTLRVKVWSLYLTLLNAIIELGPEEGKQALGSKQWRDIATKARDGTVWDEVVQKGYGRIEGNVDADVVTNLATLLLSHSASQSTNQEHLETYLATSDLPHEDPTTPTKHSRGRHKEQPTTNGTNTPRELASRLKILELYILHVLPATDEWEYAKEFIQLSEILDDERKELFQQALEQLEAETTHNEHTREPAPETEGGERHPHQTLQKAEPKPMEETEHPPDHRRSNSEQDYGIEESQQRPKPRETGRHPSSSGSVPRTARSTQQRTNKPSPSKLSRRTNGGILARSGAIITAVQNLVSTMTQTMSKKPLALLRFVLFLVALLVALSRRDIKDRIRRITGLGWDKVQRTVGMGVKVSYI